jgi:hypothetical protein
MVNWGVANVLGTHTSGDTTVTLDTGEGAKLPVVTGTYTHAYAWWFDSTNYASARLDPNREIVKITNRVTDTLTVVRGQQGTSATSKTTPAAQYVMVSGATAGEWTALYEQMVERTVLYAKLSADQTITASTNTLVELDEERFDLQSDFNTTTHIFTAPYDMIVFVSAQTSWKSAEDAKTYQTHIQKASTTLIIGEHHAARVDELTVPCSGLITMSATETLRMVAWHDSSASKDLSEIDSRTFLSIHEVMRRS